MMQDISGKDRALAVIAGILMLSALAEGEPGLFVLLVILALAYAFRNTGSQANTRQSARVYDEDYAYDDDDEYDYEPQIRRERPANVDQIHQHALRAVRNARLDPNDMQVLPVDLGLIVFRGDESPTLQRTTAIDDDVDYIQPFVQLRVPVKAMGKIKFEIYDNTRQPVFIHEDRHQLERGRNLIIPSTRLPIHDQQEMDGRWEMRITADNIIIARHAFQWQGSEDAGFHQHVGEDGELSSELRAVLAENQGQSMSLDELLAYQDEEEQGRR